MLWIGTLLLPQDGYRKAPTTALYSIVDQSDTAGRFMWNKVAKEKYSVESASNKHIGGIFMVYVGIDVAKNKHDCFILDSEGEVLADVFTIRNNAEGFDTLLQTIRRYTRPEDKTTVGLEATGHYSCNILGFLLNKGLDTYVWFRWVLQSLRFMELLGLATYEIRGWEKTEVFIRINDPEKLERLAASGKYANGVLQSIQEHHRNNERLLTAFFAADMNDDERWELIEQYFLGNEKYVRRILHIAD